MKTATKSCESRSQQSTQGIGFRHHIDKILACYWVTMNEENRLLVTYEPIEFMNAGKLLDHLNGIYETYIYN